MSVAGYKDRKVYSFKSVGEKPSAIQGRENVSAPTKPPIGIKTPIQLIDEGGFFRMHFENADQIADNLRNLILTNHGERLGNYSYGANLVPLTLEITSQEDFEIRAMESISAAVKIEMPYVELNTFSTDPENFSPFSSESGVDAGIGSGLSNITMKIKYSVPQLRVAERGLVITLTCA